MGSERSLWAGSFALALGLAACTLAPRARAQESDAGTRVAARDLAVAGGEAFDKQDYAVALDRFQRAEQLYKAPSIAVMVARCLARTGRVIEAVDKYEETMRMPIDAAAPEAFRAAVADATAEIDGVRARIARIELRLPPDTPRGAEVTLDGKVVPAALLGVPTPVNPGSHHVAATAPGRSAYNSDPSLVEGGQQTLEISFALAPVVAPPPPLQHAPPAAPPEKRSSSTLAIALLAAGGVGLAFGTVTGVAALSHKSSLDKACNPGCPQGMSSDLDAYRLDRTLSYVGFGVGVVALGAGGYFLLSKRGSGGEVGALVLPGGAALKGTF